MQFLILGFPTLFFLDFLPHLNVGILEVFRLTWEVHSLSLLFGPGVC